MKMIKINVIFVHRIELSTFTEKLMKGRNLPYPFLRGQPLKGDRTNSRVNDTTVL